jgi:polyhydroxybutyrate depolymerase
MARHAVVVERDRLKLRRRPLIIVLNHGGGLGARGRHSRGLEDAASSNKPIFVYPDPINGVWPVKPGPEADRDIRFVRDLVQHLVAQGQVDTRRIFIVGFHADGAFAYRAACAGIGHPLAGLATLISAMPDDLANCAPPAPLAYISVSGQADPLIPYAGGPSTMQDAAFTALPAETTLGIFAKIDSCGAKRDEKAIPDHDKRDRTRAFIQSYAGCKTPVELIRVEGGGHRIPGRKPDIQDEALGGDNFDFDARRAVWDFLKGAGA